MAASPLADEPRIEAASSRDAWVAQELELQKAIISIYHSLLTSYATHLLEAGVDPHLIQLSISATASNVNDRYADHSTRMKAS